MSGRDTFDEHAPADDPELALLRGTIAADALTGDIAPALAALSHAEPSVRAGACVVLARQGGLKIAALVTLLIDSSPVVRRAACEAAGLGKLAALELTQAARDPDTLTVEMACWAMGESWGATDDSVAVPDDVLAALVNAQAHADALVREAAVAAMGAIGDERSVPAIIAALDDRPTIRRRAVLALAPFGGDDVDAALQKALADRDRQVRQAAEDLL